jgi:hypothetical protein
MWGAHCAPIPFNKNAHLPECKTSGGAFFFTVVAINYESWFPSSCLAKDITQYQ